MALALKIILCSTIFHVITARTTRYEIVTKSDGSKEIINTSTGKAASPDLNFLIMDTNRRSDEVDLADEITSPPSTTSANDQDFITKWHSYTSNGWTEKNNDLYANSTKLEVFPSKIQHLGKQGRAENLTESLPSIEKETEANIVQVEIDQPGIWNVIEKLYNCFSDYDNHGGRLNCVKVRVTRMMLNFLDYSFGPTQEKAVFEQKTLHHGKKLLKGALLPLLVLLVIKYLIALPVIAAGLVTIKTFWLSLLSAGVAAFAPYKEAPTTHIIKRYRPEVEQSWIQPPAWTTDIHTTHDKIGTVATEKYFM